MKVHKNLFENFGPI